MPLVSGSLNVLPDSERTQLSPEETKRNLLLYVILVMVSLLSIRFRNGFDDSDTYRRENLQCQNLLTNYFLARTAALPFVHTHAPSLTLLQLGSAFFFHCGGRK